MAEVHTDALALLAAIRAAGEGDSVDLPHIVRCHDAETGVEGDSFHGPFAGPVEASTFAAEWAADLNRGMPDGEALFEVSVHPLRPRSE